MPSGLVVVEGRDSANPIKWLDWSSDRSERTRRLCGTTDTAAHYEWDLFQDYDYQLFPIALTELC